uniref:Uncharacterized protein n=1 Tax=Thalassionema nitzschioides TaxID=33649 RepID=A0A6V1A005_9STRA|mmetsp:Transcript_18096/g.26778  ORF Transcript_18096/g.26778 Transcript_18096/m.26778 type:complete len:542 (+) Transcript_18096:44-1669(+)
MSAIVTLPTGPLGVTFKGSNPPVIKEVKYDSSMFGNLKCGYSVQSIIRANGIEVKATNSVELAKLIKATSEDEGRKLKCLMTLPAEVEFLLPEGDVGLTVTQEKGLALVTKIDNASPLKHLVRVGMAVDCFTLPDGSTMTGCNADKVMEWLKFNQEAGRVMILKDPSLGDLSPPSYSQSNSAMEIPPGGTSILGLRFQGTPLPQLMSIDPRSELKGRVQADMVIAALRCPDGREYQGFDASYLAKLLDETADYEGRQLYLMNKYDEDVPAEPLLKMWLPVFGTAEELGLVFGGKPTRIKHVAPHSELHGLVKKNMQVVNIWWNKSPAVQDLSPDGIAESLADSSGCDRCLILTNIYDSLPDETVVTFPPGNLGLRFAETPPKVVGFTRDSVARKLVDVGMVADTLMLDSGTPYTNLEPTKLTRTLIANAGSGKRTIRFINPGVVPLTKPGDLPKPDKMSLMLPASKLFLNMKGMFPCYITQVKPNSPLVGKLPNGMAVDEVIIDGRSYSGFSAVELSKLLKESAHKPGRVLKLSNPSLNFN